MENIAVYNVFGNEHILQYIFKSRCVEIEDICRFALVNSTWRYVSSHPEFWNEIDMSGRSATPGLLCRLLQRHSHVKVLNAGRIELNTEQLSLALPLLNELRSLEMHKSSFSSTDLALISQNCPQLISLTLSGGTIETAPLIHQQGIQHPHHNHPQPVIGPGAMVHPPPPPPINEVDLIEGELNEEEMLMHMQQLDALAAAPMAAAAAPPQLPPPIPQALINAGGVIPHNATNISHPNIQRIKFTGGSCMMLVLSLPNLRTLEIERFNYRSLILQEVDALENIKIVGGVRASESELRLLLRINGVGVINRLPSLQTLTFEYAAGLSDNILERCAVGHPSVTSLYLRECSHCTGAGLGPNVPNIWPSLRHIEIADCDTVTGNQLSRGLEMMRSLHSVVIKGCSQLADLTVSSRSIQTVELISARTLAQINLTTPNLTEFSLRSEIPHMCAANALRNVSINSWALTTLKIGGCPVLSHMNLICPNLEEIELSECDDISDHVISGFGSHNNLPRLQALTLIDCRSLNFLTIQLPTLKRFKASTCREMTYVRLGCNSLEHVCLEECGGLTSIFVTSSVISHLALGSCPSLQNAHLNLPGLTSLDIKGCNQLAHLELRSPKLRSINALLCSSLTDDVMRKLGQCSDLTDLQVGACTRVSNVGFSILGGMQGLRRLDLSGMSQLEDPAPLIPMAIHLTSLSLTDNFNIEPEALREMLTTVRLQSSTLAHINVSYCKLGSAAAADLALGCRIPGSLAVNGIQFSSHSQPLWSLLHGHQDEPSELRVLSLVKCRGLSSFYLGMMPPHVAHDHSLVGGDGMFQGRRNVLECSTSRGIFLHVATPLNRLEDLQLRLGDFTNVAIALPQLRSLDLGTCLNLQEVVLQCPLLTRLCLGACGKLTLASIIAAVSGCPSLQYLDLGNCRIAGEEQALDMIRAACPTIEQVDVTKRRVYFYK